jgi:hypothetical protein
VPEASFEAQSRRVPVTKSQPWRSRTGLSRVICPASFSSPPAGGVDGLSRGAGKTWSRVCRPHSPDTSHWSSGETEANELFSFSPGFSGWTYSKRFPAGVVTANIFEVAVSAPW